MVAPSVVVVKHRTSPTQLGYISGGTTFTQLGTGMTSGENWSGQEQEGRPSNRGVWFKGCYFTMVKVPNVVQIYVYDPVANTMFNNSGVSVTSNMSITGCVSGLFVTRSADPIMFFIADGFSGGVTLNLFTTTDGRNWVVTQLSVLTETVIGFGRAVLYRNQLYIVTADYNQPWALIIVNPVTLTLTSFTFTQFGWSGAPGGTTGSPQGSLCIFRNRLFLVRQDVFGATAALKFYEFTGGTFILRNTLMASGTLNEPLAFYRNTDHFLFPIGSAKMVAICAIDTGNSQATRGTKAWDITPSTGTSFTVLEKTTPLIPPSLRTVADGGPTGVLAATHRWTGFVDNDFNATPSSPQVYIWLLSNANGGTHSYYEYVDSDTELGPGTTGPNFEFALPYGTSGGGERTYSSVGLKAIVTNIVPSPSPGRVRVTVRVYGDISPSATSTNIGRQPTLFVGRRAACVAATTAALPASTYANGAAGVGATLTRVGNGALPLQDNVSLSIGQRLLVKNQAAPAQNGIYSVTSLGDGGNPFVLTRVTDFDDFGGADLYPTAWTRVTSGDTLANTAWYFQAANPDLSVGTTAITWVQIDSSGTPLNRRLRLWYSTSETALMAQATLAGTPTQPSATPPIVTRNVNALENVIADGATEYTFDWDASADALLSGQSVHIMVRAGTA